MSGLAVAQHGSVVPASAIDADSAAPAADDDLTRASVLSLAPDSEQLVIGDLHRNALPAMDLLHGVRADRIQFALRYFEGTEKLV